ncbi:MAG: 16S rRNA (cytidine(1402)-2'-O)-methyltransferase [Fibrobacter sp.]|nr:16S rRNA (cytidine(1402)-2'-O)-methyltransferase [Fibrobacter sp.]
MALYIVSTPIGNMEDISFRAIEVLKKADSILAEDTRVSRKLLSHYDIQNKVFTYHDFNKEKVTPMLISQLKDNKELALITDAGTPGVADPAFYLVRAAIREDIPVIPIPGASAFICALVCSGLPTDRFIFENFLPHKSSQRVKLFLSLKEEPRTVIFYETPHRILKVLKELQDTLGDVKIVIARELTKIYEEFLRGTPAELLAHFEKHPPKGEMVVLFNIRF